MRVARSDYDHCLNFEPLHHEMQANPDLVTFQLKWEQSGGKQSLSPQDRFTSSHISFFCFLHTIMSGTGARVFPILQVSLLC